MSATDITVYVLPKLEVGDVVQYHFRSYVRFGSPEQEVRTRPAIVTSIEDPPAGSSSDPVLNLHVFFEDRDFVTPAQRQLQESWGPMSRERRAVKVRGIGEADNTWSLKQNDRRRRVR